MGKGKRTYYPAVRSRRDLQQALADAGERISRHGVEAWFRRRDSNLPIPRESLADSHLTFAIPKRRWNALFEVFALERDDIAMVFLMPHRKLSLSLTARA